LKEKKQAKTPPRLRPNPPATGTQKEPVTSFSELLSASASRSGPGKATKRSRNVLRVKVHEALQRSGPGRSNFLGTRDKGREQLVYRMLYYVKSSPNAGDAIKDARGSLDRGGFLPVRPRRTRMNNNGARLLCGASRAPTWKITLPSCSTARCTPAPVIRSKIPSGRAQIEGSFTMEEAKDLAIVCAPRTARAREIMEQRPLDHRWARIPSTIAS